MDSVVAVSRGGKASEAAVAAHAHMLQHQQRGNENDLMQQRGNNGHVAIDDHRNGNVVMPPGGGGGSVYAESVISSAAPLVSSRA